MNKFIDDFTFSSKVLFFLELNSHLLLCKYEAFEESSSKQEGITVVPDMMAFVYCLELLRC